LKNLISAVLIAMMLLFATAGVVIASENAAHEVSEKENKTHEQVEKNASVTQKVTEEAKEVTAKAKEEAAEKKQPGFEAAFATVGLLAVAFVALKRRN
jgi:PGF-CTERM protein